MLLLPNIFASQGGLAYCYLLIVPEDLRPKSRRNSYGQIRSRIGERSKAC
jgi:hypothetical protein